MAGKDNPLGTIAMIAAVAVASYFTFGAAGAAAAGAAEGAAAGGAAAGGAAAGGATAGGVAAGEGIAASGAMAASEGMAAGGALAAAEGLTYTTMAGEAGGAVLGETALNAGFTGAMDGALLDNAGLAAMEYIPSQEATLFAAEAPVMDAAAAGASADGAAADGAFAGAEWSDAMANQPGGGWNSGLGEVPAIDPAAAKPPADLSGAFDKPFSFGSLIGKNGTLSYGEVGGLGLAGMGGVARMGQANADTASNQQMLDAQMSQIRLQESSRELESEKRLAQVLAGQTVGFLAQGRQTGEGSARALAENAINAAETDSLLSDALGTANATVYSTRSNALARRRSTSWMTPLFAVGETAATGWQRRALLGS